MNATFTAPPNWRTLLLAPVVVFGLMGMSPLGAGSTSAIAAAPDACGKDFIQACSELEGDVSRTCQASPYINDRDFERSVDDFVKLATHLGELQPKVRDFDAAWSKCFGKVRESDCAANATWATSCEKMQGKVAKKWAEIVESVRANRLPYQLKKVKTNDSQSADARAAAEALVTKVRGWNTAMPEPARQDLSFLDGVQGEIAAAKAQQEKQDAAARAGAEAAAKKARLPVAGMHDGKLEGEMKAAIGREWKSDQILKVVITDKKWATNVNLKGRLLNRKISSVVAVKRGDACSFFDVSFIQESSDGRTLGPTAYNAVGEKTDIACGNIK